MDRPAQRLADAGALLRRTPALVFAMAVLSLGLIVAGKVAVKGIRSSGDTITVTGASTERITSDFADWRVEVSTTGPTQQASCLLYTSPSPRDQRGSRMPSSA